MLLRYAMKRKAMCDIEYAMVLGPNASNAGAVISRHIFVSQSIVRAVASDAERESVACSVQEASLRLRCGNGKDEAG